MRKTFIVLVCMVVIAAFVGTGICADANQPKENKMSMMDKIKKAYSDFRSRQQQKSQLANSGMPKQKPAPAKTMAPKIESPKAALPQAVAPKAQVPVKEMTKEEMLAELKEDIVGNDEIFNAVPELKSITGKDGSVVYAYRGIALDELSKEDLAKLYTRVNQALVKIRTDRIQGQLETIRQVERLQRSPANPPQPPRIPAQVQMPRVPAAAPSVPRTPSSPPPAPQRR